VVEWLFLDRVDAKARRTTVRRQHYRAVVPSANKAQPALALLKLAKPRAQVTLDPAVR
jgi:hypothetical protein